MLPPNLPLTASRTKHWSWSWPLPACYAMLLVAAAAALAGAAPDAGGTALDRYLDGMKSLRTAFTQTVTDARGTQVEAGAGTLEVLRPGKFRWDYLPGTAAPSGAATGTATGPAGGAT